MRFISFVFMAGVSFIGLSAACAQTLGQSYEAMGVTAPRTMTGSTHDPITTGSTNQPGAYGGGFLELLMTGRDPTPGRRGPAPGELDYRQPAPIVQPAQPIRRGRVATEPQIVPDAQATAALVAPQPRALHRAAPAEFERKTVAYSGPHVPGTIVIDTNKRYLYLVQSGGSAIRYGVGVGRPGFEWHGAKSITRKAEWPDWRPPAQMLKRRPDLPNYMKGGPDNPLGARALYLGSSLYRIHGTNEPHTIGEAVSSGCIRMTNEDVIDLYNRVRVGTRVVVM